ncbi:MAG: SprT-like domain-containing protein [Flavobacteriales bacterium]|nr:SprT-like domain-containing protein [Flavobacteriales bacterium]
MHKTESQQEAILQFKERLEPRLPKGTAGVIAKWIVELKVHFVISKPRDTKLGDFRPAHKGKAAKITVNGDLHPYAFLITTIHEFAHLGCHLKYGNKVAPHGKEWKSIYSEMLNLFVKQNVFPEDLTVALKKHIANPKASSCSCPILSAALSKYDNEEGNLLGMLGPNDQFHFKGEIYRYVQLRRTRILCSRLSDGKKYLISSRAKVQPIVTIS